MGNNHDQYFGKQKRKIIVLGLQGAGKTTLVNYLTIGTFDKNVKPTKNLNIVDKKMQNLHITFFDLGGAQRQRIFWKQQYEGTQGVMFLVDGEKYQTQKLKVLQELKKLTKNIDSQIPFCICLNKIDHSNMNGMRIKNQLNNQIASIKKIFQIYLLDFSKQQSIRQMMQWFLKQTKPI